MQLRPGWDPKAKLPDTIARAVEMVSEAGFVAFEGTGSSRRSMRKASHELDALGFDVWLGGVKGGRTIMTVEDPSRQPSEIERSFPSSPVDIRGPMSFRFTGS